MPSINDNITKLPYETTSQKIIDEDKVITGVSRIWSNPNIYNPGGTGNYLRKSVPYELRYLKRVVSTDQPTQWAALRPYGIDRYDQNKLVSDAMLVGNKVQTTTGLNSGHNSLTTVTTGMRIDASHLQSIVDVTNNIQNILNTNNSWYDAQDVCQRSCQLSCQVGCQVACMSCVTSQCHHQNCGTS
jgi:hypothetical protein